MGESLPAVSALVASAAVEVTGGGSDGAAPPATEEAVAVAALLPAGGGSARELARSPLPALPLLPSKGSLLRLADAVREFSADGAGAPVEGGVPRALVPLADLVAIVAMLGLNGFNEIWHACSVGCARWRYRISEVFNNDQSRINSFHRAARKIVDSTPLHPQSCIYLCKKVLMMR